jgi:outer membrane biosynthesis protein TonB
MYESKPLQLAILISMLLHFAVLLCAPYVGIVPKRQLLEPIKVAYYKPEVVKKKELPEQKPVGIKPESHKAPIVSPESLPEVKKEDIENPPLKPQPAVKQEQVKKEEPTVETINSKKSGAVMQEKGKKFETVVNEETDNAKKAAYIGYYRLVREKIRYYADRNYIKEGSTSEGEVFLSFAVTSKGELLHIMVMDNRSAKDPILRDIAINSIRDASPFSAFPQGMSQYQITFNVIISFEVNK